MCSFFLNWWYKNYSFWDIPCYSCGSQLGWKILFCSYRKNSFIAKASCLRCYANQFLKKYHSFDEKLSTAFTEYKTLKTLVDAGIKFNNFFNLPQAYFFSSAKPSFSMQLIEGQTIDQRMKCSESRQSFLNCLEFSAKWLKGLHEAPITHLCQTGNNSSTMFGYLDLDHYYLVANANSSSSVQITKAFTFMRFNLKDSNWEVSEKFVPIHGDFKASNLLIDVKNQIYGIDYCIRYKNFAAMDVAQFMIDLLLKRDRIQILMQDIGIAYVINYFLECYDEKQGHRYKHQVKWWLLYFLLSNWISALKGLKPRFVVDYHYSKALTEILAFCSNDQIN